jgi:histidyl-tRNA synthetase
MWHTTEEEFVNHILHCRIHNPFQYVFTCNSYKCLLAVRFAYKTVIKTEEQLLEFLNNKNKYTKTDEVKEILSKVKNLAHLLTVFMINLRHQEILKEKDAIGPAAVEKFMEDNKIQEIIENTKFTNEEELLGFFEQVEKELVYIHLDEIKRWISGDDLI